MFVISLLVSTIYNFVWDVMMDWGLGSSEHVWLRDRKLFPEVGCCFLPHYFVPLACSHHYCSFSILVIEISILYLHCSRSVPSFHMDTYIDYARYLLPCFLEFSLSNGVPPS
jgi:hypothetical protein